MKLKDYLDREEIKPIQLAHAMKVSQATIYNWLSGKIKPRLEHLKLIKKHTNNQVCPEDFYG